MKTKKILTLILSVILLMSMSISVLALDNNAGDIHVACFNDASKLSGLVADEDIIHDYSLSYNITKDSLHISGTIKGKDLLIDAKLETISYNSDALAFFGEDSCQNYEVLTTHIIQRDSLSSFFENYLNDSCTDIIKIYLKDKDSNEFIIIEIALDNNFVARYAFIDTLVFDSEKINKSLFWFTEYLYFYDEVEENDGIEPFAAKRYIEFKRYMDFEKETYKFVLTIDFYYTPEVNLSKNGSGSVEYYFTVLESSVYYSKDSGETYEKISDNQSEVKLKDLNITVAACPNIRFTSQTPIRSGLGDVAVGFKTYTDDVTAAKYLNPTTLYGYMDDYTVNLTTRNTAKTVVKTTESGTLPSGYALYKEGDTYGISLTFEDAVGTETSGTFLIMFDYYIDFPHNPSTSFPDSRLPSTNITIS